MKKNIGTESPVVELKTFGLKKNSIQLWKVDGHTIELGLTVHVILNGYRRIQLNNRKQNEKD